MRHTLHWQDTRSGTDWDVEAISIALAKHEDIYRIWFKGEMRRAFVVVGGKTGAELDRISDVELQKMVDEAQEPPTV